MSAALPAIDSPLSPLTPLGAARAAPPLPLVDAHMHLLDARLGYEWLQALPALQRDYSYHDYALCWRGQAAVQRAVFVEGNPSPEMGREELEWMLRLVDDRSTVVASCVPWVPLEAPDAADYLYAMPRHRGLRGVRRLLQGEPDGFALQPQFRSNLKIVERLGLHFEVCCVHSQLGAVLDLVRSFPSLRFVLNHIAKPSIRSGAFEPWAAQLAELARERNVVCKLSGVVTEADTSTRSSEHLVPYMRHAYESFGAERLLFGSDWPVVTLGCPYVEWLEQVVRFLDASGVPARERHSIFFRTAESVYDLEACC